MLVCTMMHIMFIDRMLLAIVWLSENNVNHDPIVADPLAINKLLTYGDIYALNENFPAVHPQKCVCVPAGFKRTIVSVGQ